MSAAPGVQLTLTEADAKRLTMKIKLLAGAIADQIDTVTDLIAQAKAGRADVVLGYPSWTAYCAAEFAGALPRLERQARRELVANLTEMGMSARAIAPIAGTTHKTVVMDRQEQVVPPVPPDDDADVIDAELVEEADPIPTPITGRDGKTYPIKPTLVEPRKPRRRPLPDAYADAVHGLLKAAERIERLQADDRFPANRDAVMGRRHELVRAVSILLDHLHEVGLDDMAAEAFSRLAGMR